jgi:UDP-N-acetylmuramoylalanine-D-glutamate ligase
MGKGKQEMSFITDQIDQAMPPGTILPVTLENFQNVCSALILARQVIVKQEAQLRALMRFHSHRGEMND